MNAIDTPPPATTLDPVIHAPVRLQICAILSMVSEAEFALVREQTGVSDSVLSKQTKQLEEAGYLSIRKGRRDEARPCTWLALTKAGRVAFDRHMRALTELAAIAAAGAPVS